MRMDNIENDHSDYQSENHGDDASTVACLAVARKLACSGFHVAVSGYRTVRIPAKSAAGSKEYEDQSIGGRAHRNASLAMSAHPRTWGCTVSSRTRNPIGAESLRHL